MAVGREGRLLSFTQLIYACGIIFDQIMFTAGAVLRKQTAECMILIIIPYKIGGLFAGLDVRTTTVGARIKSKASRLSAIVRFGLAV